MNNRKFKSDKAALIAEGKRIASSSDDAKFLRKVTPEDLIGFQMSKKGSKPKVKSYPGRKSVAYSGFVLPKTGELFATKPSWFHQETTISCMNLLRIGQLLRRDISFL